ncbi:MAG: hypothetical protein QOJ92_2989 [Frankiales bacterium]|jgi:hypothetical protein|nr:hypothetical protein [Frankiales bacterium]
MSELSSPAASRLGSPRWLDPRLLGGVLLVLLSVVLGTRVVSAADHSQLVWAAAHDLAPGASVEASDLTAVRSRLFGAGGLYLSAEHGSAPVGYVVTRPVAKGELVPLGALARDTSDTRLVTVPVKQFHLPLALAEDERVDVYVTIKPRGSETPAPPTLVLPNAVVASVQRGGGRLGGSGADNGVVLRVPTGAVPALIAAIQRGDIDLVRVPRNHG